MTLYDRYVLPPLLNLACSCRPIRAQRAQIVPLARGVVIELGFGAGLNLPHYDASQVTKLYALEPAEGMLARARKQVRAAPFAVEILPECAERMSLPDASVDTVVVTYSLCTIPNPYAALLAAYRVLKPGGRLLFAEHGAAPEAQVRAWQRRIEPAWRVVSGGCHLTRDTPHLIRAAGFEFETLDCAYLPKTPSWSGYNYWGIARPA
ncbi:MAG: class I SAM-dependent methyltransferase [Hyphomonadaceae bacterium]|nr:class I SAM-dependent methyltransferase [Hyphomonadaceae bacterium]